ncbi:acetyltransferase [Sorangium atrum]|uniref:Acetyltransferase n=1 Tax=Sorangium atrum TaxID=2995308 RepID=A0ABT5BZ24_9BACT|nr:acetyltransferase [Sorangium aterium]MDC0679400.1 acetyltransferase [Sorangium aterium]
MEARDCTRPAAPAVRRLSRLGPLLAAALSFALPGCVEAVTVEQPPPPPALGVRESRTLTLEFLRFDARRFAKTLTLDELKAIPRPTLEGIWLLDLDISTLIENALLKVMYMPPAEVAALSPASRNLVGLLNMTPENADLSGTSLEGLLGVGNAVGLSTSKILSDLTGAAGNERLIPVQITSQAVLENLVSTHPNTQHRRGPVDDEHPDGVYPVAPHSIPVTLYDVVTDFAGLAAQFGPTPLDPGDPDGAKHPGFIKAASGVKAALDDFTMTVRVDVNALPYKGVDATMADVASVNSTPGQIDTLFDFSQDDWLVLDNLARNLSIGELTLAIPESAMLLPGGTSREPAPRGNSPVWEQPLWEFEHILARAGELRAAKIKDHCSSYGPAGTSMSDFEAVKVCIDESGWTEISVDQSVVLEDPPPAPSYFWDILLDVAQARLHDGGLAEGEADLEVTLRDVPVGVKTEDLVASIKKNLASDPAVLKDMALELNDNAAGDADFYLYQPSTESGVAGQRDYLYFVAPDDIRKDADGVRVRDYAYESPGFFSDPALEKKVSTTEEIDGDALHEKVEVKAGDTLYFADDEGHRYEIEVGDKPSPHRLSLTLTRIQ